MVWSYAEANPMGNGSGSWNSLFKNFLQSFERAFIYNFEIPTGIAVQQDAHDMTVPATTLSTDPPYYDNIGYADLSDFFYVWLRRNLRDVYPDLFQTLLVPKASELIVAPHRHENKDDAKAFFEAGMLETFTNLRNSVRPDYPVSIYYAYKQQDMGVGEDRPSSGWETMLGSLISAGFQIVGTWPMRTELTNRSNSLGANALASSIVLVCRVRPEDAPVAGRRDFTAALRRELPEALDQLLSGNLAATDLAQASIGPGMAIFSRFSRVLEPDGNKMSVRVALGLINRALDDFFAEQDGDLDAETRFAIAWFEKFAFEPGPFGEADVLARARNTAVASVERAGLARSEAGRVSLLRREDYQDWQPQADQRPTIWEGTHHLIRCLQRGGEEEAADLLRNMEDRVDTDESWRLAYRLYHICERTQRAAHARDYNDLVDSWPEILRLANEAGPRQTAMDL